MERRRPSGETALRLGEAISRLGSTFQIVRENQNCLILTHRGIFFLFLSLPIQNLIFHRIISTTMSISLWQREGAKGREQALKSAHVCMKADSAALTGFKEGSGGKLSTTSTNSRTARTSSGCRVGLGEKEGGEGRGSWCYEKARIDMHACKCDLDTRCLTACCSQRENQSLPHPHRLPPPLLSCQCACARARVWKTSV